MSCWMSSSRVHTTFTGPSTCWAMRTALAAMSGSSRRPKPPPSRWLCTVTLSSGSPTTFAAVACTRASTCVPIQTSQPSGRHVHRAVHRLHRRVRQERQLVVGLEPIALRQAPCRRRRPFSRPRRPCALAARRSSQISRELTVRVRAFVPGDVERVEALLRGPHVIADHRDEIVEHDDLPHAGDRLAPRCRRHARPCRRRPGSAASVANFMPGSIASMP